MQIALLTAVIRLPGCGSLKEKRQRLGGLRDRLGRLPSIALCESAAQDVHDRSEWTFVVLATDASGIEQGVAAIDAALRECVDGEVLRITRERL